MISLEILSKMFNEALFRVWNLKNFLILYFSLLISGILILFFRLLSFYAPVWLKMPLIGIPFFFMAGFTMAAGAIVCHFYYREKQGNPLDLRKTLFSFGEVAFKSSFFALVLLLCFIFLCITVGIFQLLKMLPLVGSLLGVVLAFGPFIMHVCMILLFIAAVLFAFFIVPKIGLESRFDFQPTLNFVAKEPFSALILFIVSLIPLCIAWKITKWAALFTFEVYSFEEAPLLTTLQGLFICVPFMVIITAAVQFFFNFAVETLLWKQESH